MPHGTELLNDINEVGRFARMHMRLLRSLRSLVDPVVIRSAIGSELLMAPLDHTVSLSDTLPRRVAALDASPPTAAAVRDDVLATLVSGEHLVTGVGDGPIVVKCRPVMELLGELTDVTVLVFHGSSSVSNLGYHHIRLDTRVPWGVPSYLRY